MALRIKSHWWNAEQARSVPEIAGALAFIAWRLSVEKAVNLHCERFVYTDDRQRMAVIQEYLVFLIQIADRLCYGIMSEDDRRTLITTVVTKVIEQVQDNGQDLFGDGNHGRPFIALLNRRSDEYAQLHFDGEGPSYPFLRHLGYEIQCVMGQQEENRWVIDQVMDKDGWEAYQQFSGTFRNLFE
ncbi:hypothetical protein [Candidatus Thiosymbion oneisti]|uniref:hypothetical protein n=1 Tax=Candidatus Thiosymbion oneisti TaxID=589554 RepID=UPI0010602A92|nr:hypothetical protein [Candidatus Thiosymbion oneisti]